jgi:tetratricopeptide (TPR) repeat protein
VKSKEDTEKDEMEASMDALAYTSFGDLLKAFRKKRKVNQQTLAKALGMHFNTISKWECGVCLPETKGTVLEIARHLRLDAHETRQLLEASLTALAPHWSVPPLRNPFFTGREEYLEALHASLGAEHGTALQSYALNGLGGIGKTQLAGEYAYRYGLEYSAVFWIEAENYERIVASFLRIADLLQLPARQETDQQRIVLAVQHWLAAHGKWLLIWDNLEEVALLPQFLPSARQGALLITTRCQALGTFAQTLEVSPMPLEEGMLLLLRRARLLDPSASIADLQQLALTTPAEYTAARELVSIMGGLPLALDQAGAYIEETGCGLTDYIQRYEQQRAQLLRRRGSLGTDHPRSVMATFLLTSQRVAQEQPTAIDLLHLCAFLHAEDIPEELFVADGPSASALPPVTTDPYQLDLIIAALRTFSLIQRQSKTRTLSIHRLVQAVLQEEMSEQQRVEFRQRVIRLLNASFPEVTHGTWARCERLLPHVLACMEGTADQFADRAYAEVVRKAADYLRERGQYGQAEPLYQQALYIQGRLAEAEPLQLASSLHGLARLSSVQRKYEQAEEYYRRAIALREQYLGPEHPDVASSLNGLAILYYRRDQIEQAEPLCQQALRIWEQALGPDHPEVAFALNNLAIFARGQGRLAEAECFYQRALRIWEQSGNQNVGYALNNLAELYKDQGRYTEAESFFQRALSIWEQSMGPEHPLTAMSLNGLANTYQNQGRYEEAELLYQRALHIREQRLGSCHPETAETLADFARACLLQGKRAEAEALYQQALPLQEALLGPDHPSTIETRERLLSLRTGKEQMS